MRLMYSKSDWDLNLPKLIISVIGSEDDFSLPCVLRSAFKQGLARAASSAQSWIITGGTDSGVMKLVDETVAEWKNMSSQDFVVLGIANIRELDEKFWKNLESNSFKDGDVNCFMIKKFFI